MKDWNDKEIKCARSKGGVIATADPFDNLIKTGSYPWPPSELTQKLYQSRHLGAFEEEERELCISGKGFYCDLQSIHSEDAITWSVFGTVARASEIQRTAWLNDLFELLELSHLQKEPAEIFLWRRIPHPDTLVPGGPEIDFGISTGNAIILGEAKWLSGIGRAQGKGRNKDQIQLRGEFLERYKGFLYPEGFELIVLGVGLFESAFINTVPEGIIFKTLTWESICSLASHPCAEELKKYYEWKKANTRIARGKI